MSSSSFEQRICAMFDSFCKTVSRNYVRNLERAERNRQKHIVDAPILLFLDLMGRKDIYPSDKLSIDLDGRTYEIKNEWIYQALMTLPEKHRNVLIFSFWEEFSDKEIASKLEVTPRTVYNLKQRAFSGIREFYEKRGRDP